MLDIQNGDGNTALHIAAVYGLSDVCKLLLREGASRTVINRAGKKPLDYFEATDRALEVLELLDVEENEQRHSEERMTVTTSPKPQKMTTEQTGQREYRERRRKRSVKSKQKGRKRHKNRR